MNGSYKVDADNQLGFAPIVAFHLCQTVVRVRSLRWGARAVSVAMRLLRLLLDLLLLHGVVARRSGLLVELLLVLRGVCMATAGVDGRRGHGGGRALSLRVTRGAVVGVGI
jgi:hypothetical protein